MLVPGELGSDKNYSLPKFASIFPNRDVVKITNMMTKMVIGISGAEKKIDEGNAYVYSLSEKYPERIIQFYWVKLSSHNVLENLKRDYEEYKFKGIKFHQCWESFKVGSGIFHNVSDWAALNEHPIFIHLFSKKEVKKLAEYIKTYSETIFIIGHLFGLEHYMKANIKSDNIYFEISSPQLISKERLMKAIQHFGSEKIILGSDTPYGKNNLKLNIERIRALNIPYKQKNLILGENIQRVLKLL